jgi:hypothetical protein
MAAFQFGSRRTARMEKGIGETLVLVATLA